MFKPIREINQVQSTDSPNTVVCRPTPSPRSGSATPVKNQINLKTKVLRELELAFEKKTEELVFQFNRKNKDKYKSSLISYQLALDDFITGNAILEKIKNAILSISEEINKLEKNSDLHKESFLFRHFANITRDKHNNAVGLPLSDMESSDSDDDRPHPKRVETQANILSLNFDSDYEARQLSSPNWSAIDSDSEASLDEFDPNDETEFHWLDPDSFDPDSAPTI